MKSRRWITPSVLALLLAFWMFVALCIPYCPIDDFQWGMEQGLRWWLGGLLNGRYVGNMFSVVMCRFPPAKVVLIGLSMFLIPTLAAWLAIRGKRDGFLPALLLCHAGILLMPPLMWNEVYGWVSGFSIYGVSTLFVLIWFLVLRQVERRRTRTGLLFLLTLFLGLFVENVTLTVLGASLVLVLFSLRHKSLRLPFLACLLGATLALIPMFFNSVVTQLLSSGTALNELRHLSFLPHDGPLAILHDILKRYVETLLPIAFLRGSHFAVPLALITACAFWNGPLRPMALSAVVPLVYRAHMMALPTSFWKTEVGPLEDLIILLSWFLPVLALAVQRESTQLRQRQILVYLAAPVSLLPFAATTTIGHRMFLLPLALVLLTAADVSLPLLRRRGALFLTGAALIGLMFLWGGRCGEALACTSLRTELIREAIDTGADTLILPNDRQYAITVRLRNPGSVEYAYYFREFFHIPQDVTLVFLPAGSCDDWPEISPEVWDARAVFQPSDDFVSNLPASPIK